MKAEHIALAQAAVALAVVVYRGRQSAPSVTYVQAARRTDAESVLVGIGEGARGVGEGIASILGAVTQPRIGMGGSSSSSGS